MNDNEKLIEEAAKAMWAANGPEEWERETGAEQAEHLTLASAALAVFEKAHTPTDDKREALTSAAHKEADQRYGVTDWTDGPGSSTFRRVDRGKAGAFVDGALWSDRRSEPRGEPSAAQVYAALDAWLKAKTRGIPEPNLAAMRAALIAAGGAR